MAGYIDGFVFAVAEDQLEQYQRVATAVAEIYREHGASNYVEFVGDDLRRDGTRSFTELVSAAAGEAVIFGWVEFEGREARDRVNALVAADPGWRGSSPRCSTRQIAFSMPSECATPASGRWSRGSIDARICRPAAWR